MALQQALRLLRPGFSQSFHAPFEFKPVSTTLTRRYGAKSDSGPPLENASLLKNLTVLGVDVRRARQRQPGVFRKVETNERVLVDFLGGKGASRDVIASIISRFPRAVTRSEEHLEERWGLWRGVFKSDAEVVKILHRSPESFFRSSDNANLEKNIRYLSSLGITPKSLHRFLTMAPRIFSNSLELNRTMVQLLEDVCAGLGGDDGKDFARTVISRNAYILTRSTKRVRANIEFLLSELRLADAEALALLRGHGASVLDLSHESLKTNFRNLQQKLKSLGCGDAEVKRMVLSYALLLFVSSETLNRKLDCLTGGGIEIGAVVEKPRVLDYSADTLQQRLSLLHRLGYDFKRNGIAVLDQSNKRFDSRLQKLREIGE